MYLVSVQYCVVFVFSFFAPFSIFAFVLCDFFAIEQLYGKISERKKNETKIYIGTGLTELKRVLISSQNTHNSNPQTKPRHSLRSGGRSVCLSVQASKRVHIEIEYSPVQSAIGSIIEANIRVIDALLPSIPQRTETRKK